MATSIEKIRFRNVILLGLGFLFIYTTYNTTAATGDTVLKSYNEDHPDNIDGEIGMALNYAGTTIMAILVPGLLIFMSRKILVIVGGVMSLTMAASYIYPTVATVYIFSFVAGVGGAFLWVGQGAEVLANSNSDNIDYHSALFWFLYQISQFAGNLYVFFAWQGTDYINSKMRIQLYSILVGVGSCGLVCFAFIKLVPNEDLQVEEDQEEVEQKSVTEKFVESLQSVMQAIRYCGSPHFIQLMIITMYIGFELAFFQTIFPTAVGATKVLPDSTRLVGLIACLVGAGEVIGSFSSGLLSKIEFCKRGPIAAFGLFIEVIAYTIIMIMLPNDSTMHNTYKQPIIEPSEAALCSAAFLIGAGDAFLNSQLMNFIQAVTKTDSETEAAFMMFNVVESGIAAIMFGISSLLTLQVQLLIIGIFLIACLACFLKLDFDVRFTDKYKHE